MSRYKVIIPYREPTYELHSGRPRKDPFIAPYEVTAITKEAAIRSALSLFEKDAHNSHVGWRRNPEYEKIQVTRLSE